jgi:tetratricopeptide (TPR) repeat protein
LYQKIHNSLIISYFDILYSVFFIQYSLNMSRLEQLQNFLKDSPKDPFLLFAVAKEHDSLGDPQKALDFYLTLRETTPQYVGLYYHLGKLYERLQQPNDALEAYKTGIVVAKEEKDMHAYNELVGAKMNVSDEDDDDDY